MQKKSKIIYLDYAAATPLDPRVQEFMQPFFGSVYGNPSSLHKKGTEAKQALEESRAFIARTLGAQKEEIIFTSGGTEGANLAILGTALAFENKGHVISTQTEHHAVLEPLKHLESLGVKVTYLPVNEQGFVSVKDVENAIRKDTFLVSVMYANNEIGTIQPILEIGHVVAKANRQRTLKKLPSIIFHTDACQAPGFLDLSVNKLGIDIMSFSASKFYGPKGVGFVYLRKGTKVSPIAFGGGQEKGVRSGTENLPGVMGMAKALELAVKNSKKESASLAALRDYFIEQALKLKDVKLNGFWDSLGTKPGHDLRLPNNISLSFKGVEGEDLMLYLDGKGICVSTGSACSTGSTERSHVIESIKQKKDYIRGTVRISLGKKTTKKDLDYLLKVLPEVLKTLRSVQGINS